jgi:hypothetical protein
VQDSSQQKTTCTESDESWVEEREEGVCEGGGGVCEEGRERRSEGNGSSKWCYHCILVLLSSHTVLSVLLSTTIDPHLRLPVVS